MREENLYLGIGSVQAAAFRHRDLVGNSYDLTSHRFIGRLALQVMLKDDEGEL